MISGDGSGGVVVGSSRAAADSKGSHGEEQVDGTERGCAVGDDSNGELVGR